ncbi:hypothetical protein ABIA27_001060 [Sinorhizobium fredii]
MPEFRGQQPTWPRPGRWLSTRDQMRPSTRDRKTNPSSYRLTPPWLRLHSTSVAIMCRASHPATGLRPLASRVGPRSYSQKRPALVFVSRSCRHARVVGSERSTGFVSPYTTLRISAPYLALAGSLAAILRDSMRRSRTPRTARQAPGISSKGFAADDLEGQTPVVPFRCELMTSASRSVLQCPPNLRIPLWRELRDACKFETANIVPAQGGTGRRGGNIHKTRTSRASVH